MATAAPILAPSIPSPNASIESFQQSILTIVQEHQLSRPAAKPNAQTSAVSAAVAIAIARADNV